MHNFPHNFVWIIIAYKLLKSVEKKTQKNPGKDIMLRLAYVPIL